MTPLRGARQRLSSRRLSPGESAWCRTGEEWEGARRTEKDEKNRRGMRTEKSLEGMRTEERRGAGGETRRDAEEEKDERAREGMGEGGELKKVGANTERGRQQKTVVGLSQAILSMLRWDAVRGKRRTRA